MCVSWDVVPKLKPVPHFLLFRVCVPVSSVSPAGQPHIVSLFPSSFVVQRWAGVCPPPLLFSCVRGLLAVSGCVLSPFLLLPHGSACSVLGLVVLYVHVATWRLVSQPLFGVLFGSLFLCASFVRDDRFCGVQPGCSRAQRVCCVRSGLFLSAVGLYRSGFVSLSGVSVYRSALFHHVSILADVNRVRSIPALLR